MAGQTGSQRDDHITDELLPMEGRWRIICVSGESQVMEIALLLLNPGKE